MTLTTLLKCTSSCLLDELIGNLRRQAYLRSKDIKQSRFSLHSFELTINFQSDQEVLSSFFMKISEMILTICWKDFSQEKFNERVLTTATTTEKKNSNSKHALSHTFIQYVPIDTCSTRHSDSAWYHYLMRNSLLFLFFISSYPRDKLMHIFLFSPSLSLSFASMYKGWTLSCIRHIIIQVSVSMTIEIIPERPSLLSSSSGYENYRGFLNLLYVILAIGSFRLVLENILKYGLLVEFDWPLRFAQDPTNWPSVRRMMHVLISKPTLSLSSLSLSGLTHSLSQYLHSRWTLLGNSSQSNATEDIFDRSPNVQSRFTINLSSILHSLSSTECSRCIHCCCTLFHCIS